MAIHRLDAEVEILEANPRIIKDKHGEYEVYDCKCKFLTLFRDGSGVVGEITNYEHTVLTADGGSVEIMDTIKELTTNKG